MRRTLFATLTTFAIVGILLPSAAAAQYGNLEIPRINEQCEPYGTGTWQKCTYGIPLVQRCEYRVNNHGEEVNHRCDRIVPM